MIIQHSATIKKTEKNRVVPICNIITDPDLDVQGLSGFIINGLMEAHDEKAYLRLDFFTLLGMV